MATKALLDRNPNPNNQEIQQALEHNLCRCTGYVKIIDAVRLAAKELRINKNSCVPGTCRIPMPESASPFLITMPSRRYVENRYSPPTF